MRRVVLALAVVALVGVLVPVAAVAASRGSASMADAPLRNGGFDAGSLLAWTASGGVELTRDDPHGGRYAALLRGDGARLERTFTAPKGSGLLQLWYRMDCPDAGGGQWAAVTLRDAATGAEAMVLPPSCTTGQGWRPAAAAVVAGRRYALTLAGHGTTIRYDDVRLAAVPALAGLTRVATDPTTGAPGQHATMVEPDTFAWGTTVVAAAQLGRTLEGGASALGYMTSHDAGVTWQSGVLPGLSVASGGRWARVSDPSVAYDVRHGTWLVAGIGVSAKVTPVAVTVSRSTDGLSWQPALTAIGGDGREYDKEWIACDNSATSRFYGTCYIEVDIPSSDGLVVMSRSTDGGATWSKPVQVAGGPLGVGGQPVVRPDGTVVVSYVDGEGVRAFRSTDGGGSWTGDVQIAVARGHRLAGGLRDAALPTAEIDAAGRVYVAWADCRFRSRCEANDIVYATSDDGLKWSPVRRVPIDATSSRVDHFIPGIGVDPATTGHLGLYYHFYPDTSCQPATCQLQVGYVSSVDGGTTWSAARTVAGPFSVAQVARARSLEEEGSARQPGRMVGDYISCSIVAGRAVSVFAVARPPAGGVEYDQAMYTVGPLPVTGPA